MGVSTIQTAVAKSFAEQNHIEVKGPEDLEVKYVAHNYTESLRSKISLKVLVVKLLQNRLQAISLVQVNTLKHLNLNFNTPN